MDNPDKNSVYIEGDSGANVYSRIIGTVNKCTNSTETPEIVC